MQFMEFLVQCLWFAHIKLLVICTAEAAFMYFFSLVEWNVLFIQCQNIVRIMFSFPLKQPIQLSQVKPKYQNKFQIKQSDNVFTE